MRTTTAFFYAIVFCAATFILYFMLELMNSATGSRKNQRMSPGNTPEEEQSVDALERKLDHLEETIRRNQELVVSLQANLTALLVHQVPFLQEKLVASREVRKTEKIDSTGSDVITTTAVAVYREKAKYPVETTWDDTVQCPAGDWTPANADIKMFDAYEVIPFDNVDGGAWKQGWELTYLPTQWTAAQPLQVFIVPHSHNDPGWLRTFEQYFDEQTKQIFDLMVRKLPANSKRRFIWAEVSYLALWWATAKKESRAMFKKLVKEGQVELVTGGWVMNDEANSHYSAMFNQMIEGHEWIRNHIGAWAVPRHGWSIDPFGLSSTMAYVLKLHEFDGMLIQRAHYSVKKHLGQKKALEFRWRQEWDQTGATEILTHLMPFYSYDIPHTCGPEPKICCQFDFRRIPGSSGKQMSCPWGVPPRGITPENVQERAETLLDQYRKKAQLTQTNVVLAPLGDDFRYDSPLEWDRQFQNYEKLLRYYASRPDLNVQIQFGTLKDYFDAVKKDVLDRKLTLPSLSGDFFTYADRDDHYWSGYYTSRPFHKSLERKLEARLRAAEIAFSMALARFQRNPTDPAFPNPEMLLTKLSKSRRNLALFQHHDGVTGTSKTAVMDDYADKMIDSLTSCDEVLAGGLSYLLQPQESGKSGLGKTSLESDEKFERNNRPPLKTPLEVSVTGRRVVVYNSLGQTREEVVVVGVNASGVVIMEESTGKTVASQINPVWLGKSHNIAFDTFELAFIASVPALGIKSYLIKPSPPVNVHSSRSSTAAASVPASVELFSEAPVQIDAESVFDVKSHTYPSSITLENSAIKLTFNGKTGYLQKFASVDGKISLGIALKFIQYGTTNKADKSGAYLFMPDGEAADVLVDGIMTEQKNGVTLNTSTPLLRVLRGPITSEIHLILPQFTHTVRLTHTTGPDSLSPEITNQVDLSRTSNYELALHLTTGLQSDGFVTDLNGFQLIRRKTRQKLPLQANYYPMPGMAILEDDAYRLSLLGRQPLGVASLVSGSLEVMLDRRLDQDDNRGVGQPVKDNVPGTESSFRLVVESNRGGAGGGTLRKRETFPVLSLLAHSASVALLNPFVVLSEAAGSTSLESPIQAVHPGLLVDLPCDVHLLNIRTAVASESENDTVIASPFSPVPGDYAGATALMLLHRVGVDCTRQTGPVKCRSLVGKLDLKKFLQPVFAVPFLEEGSPSPLARGTLASVDGRVALSPMQIHAYRLPLI